MKIATKVLEHKIFRIGIYAKSIYGIMECIAGMFLLIAGSRSLTRIVQFIFGYELIEDPNDILGNFFMNLANNLSLRMHIFLGVFLIVHGLVSIGIVMALIHKKKWAFPIVGIVLALFIIYQVYQIIYTYSILMIVLTIIDIIILSLLKFEYDRQYGKKK